MISFCGSIIRYGDIDTCDVPSIVTCVMHYVRRSAQRLCVSVIGVTSYFQKRLHVKNRNGGEIGRETIGGDLPIVRLGQRNVADEVAGKGKIWSVAESDSKQAARNWRISSGFLGFRVQISLRICRCIREHCYLIRAQSEIAEINATRDLRDRRTIRKTDVPSLSIQRCGWHHVVLSIYRS